MSLDDLLVAVAHSGRTLRCAGQDTVAALQQALAQFLPGAPSEDQILMLDGQRLDPVKPVSMYMQNRRQTEQDEGLMVFLYLKSYLKPGTFSPPADLLPPITAKVPPALTADQAAAAVVSHPLAGAPHAEARALPHHELSFAHHVAQAAAYQAATRARLERAQQLLSEQEVQSRAADAARANVEAHYVWISTAMASFMDRYQQQCLQHAQLLASFSEDQALLDSLLLHPGLQSEGSRRLADLPTAVRARDAAVSCRRSHAVFSQKVSELEGLYEGLKLDMESLMFQAPSVDLDSLGVELATADGWAGEQASVLQVLQKDLGTARGVVEQAVRQLTTGGGSGSSGQHGPNSASHASSAVPSTAGTGWVDSSQALEQLLRAHVREALPRVALLDTHVAALEARFMEAKQNMTVDVVTILQRISQQQSKIRDMRQRLTGFDSLLMRHDALFNDLRPLGRLPAAYRALLAECERRRAWHELQTGQASLFMEGLVRGYEQEMARRQSFLQQVERWLPSEILGRAGLVPSHLPLPSLSMPPPPAGLLPCSLADIQRVPLTPPAVLASMAAMAAVLSASGGPTWEGAAGEGAGKTGALPEPTSMPFLSMENARLRTELAGLLAEASLARLAGLRRPGGGGASTLVGGSVMFGTAPAASTAGVTGLGATAAASPAPRTIQAGGWAHGAPGTSLPTHGTSPLAAAVMRGGGGAPVSASGGGPASMTRSTSWRRHTATLPAPLPGTSPLDGGVLGGGASGITPPMGQQASFTHDRTSVLGGPRPPQPLHNHSNSQGAPSSSSSAAPSAPPSAGTTPAGRPGLYMSGAGGPGGWAVGPQGTPAAASVLTPRGQAAARAGQGVEVSAGSGGAAGGDGAPGALAEAEVAVAALQQVVATQDSYATHLGQEIVALSGQVQTYEARILHLEDLLRVQALQQLLPSPAPACATASVSTSTPSDAAGHSSHPSTTPEAAHQLLSQDPGLQGDEEPELEAPPSAPAAMFSAGDGGAEASSVLLPDAFSSQLQFPGDSQLLPEAHTFPAAATSNRSASISTSSSQELASGLLAQLGADGIGEGGGHLLAEVQKLGPIALAAMGASTRNTTPEPNVSPPTRLTGSRANSGGGVTPSMATGSSRGASGGEAGRAPSRGGITTPFTSASTADAVAGSSPGSVGGSRLRMGSCGEQADHLALGSPSEWQGPTRGLVETRSAGLLVGLGVGPPGFPMGLGGSHVPGPLILMGGMRNFTPQLCLGGGMQSHSLMGGMRTFTPQPSSGGVVQPHPLTRGRWGSVGYSGHAMDEVGSSLLDPSLTMRDRSGGGLDSDHGLPHITSHHQLQFSRSDSISSGLLGHGRGQGWARTSSTMLPVRASGSWGGETASHSHAQVQGSDVCNNRLLTQPVHEPGVDADSGVVVAELQSSGQGIRGRALSPSGSPSGLPSGPGSGTAGRQSPVLPGQLWSGLESVSGSLLLAQASVSETSSTLLSQATRLTAQLVSLGRDGEAGLVGQGAAQPITAHSAGPQHAQQGHSAHRVITPGLQDGQSEAQAVEEVSQLVEVEQEAGPEHSLPSSSPHSFHSTHSMRTMAVATPSTPGIEPCNDGITAQAPDNLTGQEQGEGSTSGDSTSAHGSRPGSVKGPEVVEVAPLHTPSPVESAGQVNPVRRSSSGTQADLDVPLQGVEPGRQTADAVSTAETPPSTVTPAAELPSNVSTSTETQAPTAALVAGVPNPELSQPYLTHFPSGVVEGQQGREGAGESVQGAVGDLSASIWGAKEEEAEGEDAVPDIDDAIREQVPHGRHAPGVPRASPAWPAAGSGLGMSGLGLGGSDGYSSGPLE